jgi:hypothetical protein
MSKLEWEEEHILLNMIKPTDPGVPTEWHLKKLVPRHDHPRPYKVSVAWIALQGKRKYVARVLNPDQNFIVQHEPFFDMTFRSLKQAKAWCLAVYTLEQ